MVISLAACKLPHKLLLLTVKMTYDSIGLCHQEIKYKHELLAYQVHEPYIVIAGSQSVG
jgi:hypothetical protein